MLRSRPMPSSICRTSERQTKIKSEKAFLGCPSGWNLRLYCFCGKFSSLAWEVGSCSQKMADCRNVKDGKSFFGCLFLFQSLKQELCTSSRCFKRKSTVCIWITTQNKIQELLCILFTTAPVLTIVELNRPFTVYPDASIKAIEAAFMQEGPN